MNEKTIFSIYKTPKSPYLQGLRALAVLAVILYHSHSAALPGGYVGVDAFFVLSGFLITRKIFVEVELTGRLDFFGFVADRAKRLLPNAALVLVATTVAAIIFLPAYRHFDVAADARSAALLFSNFHFANEAVDYLRLGAPPSPVLHFWSLSIEEQFYLAWPLAIVILAAFAGKNLRAAKTLLALICVLSFGSSLLAIEASQPSAFFETQNRVWQLAVGGIVGAHFHHRAKLSSYLRGAFTYVAIAGLAWSVLAFSDDLRYPGAWALVPTCSMALLLVGLDASTSGPLRSFLSSSLLVWVGDRSYSLYLWHWPVLVFAAALWPMTPFLTMSSLAVIFAVSHIAYQFLEDPIRRAAWPISKSWQRAAASTSAVIVLATSTFAVNLVPLPQAAAERVAAIEAAAKDLGQNYTNGCHLSEEPTEVQECTFGDLDGEKSVVLFGDSHAAQWFTPVERASRDAGWQLRALTKTSCTSADVTVWLAPQMVPYDECNKWREAVIKDITEDPPDLIIVANSSHYSGWLLSSGDRKVIYGSAAAAEWQSGMEKTVRALLSSGSEVVVIRDNPKMYSDFLDCLSIGDYCSRPQDEALSGIADDQRLLDIFGGRLRVLDLSDKFCIDGKCPAKIGGEIVYRDDNHMTASFALSLWTEFSPLLVKSPNSDREQKPPPKSSLAE